MESNDVPEVLTPDLEALGYAIEKGTGQRALQRGVNTDTKLQDPAAVPVASLASSR